MVRISHPRHLSDEALLDERVDNLLLAICQRKTTTALPTWTSAAAVSGCWR